MKRAPRVLVGGVFHESHSFLPGELPADACQILRGEALLAARGDSSPLGAGLDEAAALGWEVIPGIDLRAMPAQPIEDAVLDAWLAEWEAAVAAALEGGLDGVYLVLHGAMCTRKRTDVEGLALEITRRLVGPGIPIGGPTDLHANFTALMARHSDGLLTYRENPHTDAAETARRAARLLDELMRAENPGNTRRAVTAFAGTNIVWPPTGTGTANSPMRELEALARRLESEKTELLGISVHGGYAYSDTPDTGVSFTAIARPGATGENAARAAVTQLHDLAWSLRTVGVPAETPLGEALDKTEALLKETGGKTGPIVLVEPADNIGGGAPGDGTHILRAVLERGIEGAGAIIDDAAAVRALASLEIGATTSLKVGGHSGPLGGEPLQLEVTLLGRTDGDFDLEDEHSHLAAMYGTHIHMGPCATVKSGGATILLTSLKTPPFDLGQWRSQGVTPESLAVVIVKAAVAHRRAYDPMSRASFTVATPGACTSDLGSLPFVHLRRPKFPLDTDCEPEPTVVVEAAP